MDTGKTKLKGVRKVEKTFLVESEIEGMLPPECPEHGGVDWGLFSLAQLQSVWKFPSFVHLLTQAERPVTRQGATILIPTEWRMIFNWNLPLLCKVLYPLGNDAQRSSLRDATAIKGCPQKRLLHGESGRDEGAFSQPWCSHCPHYSL